MPPQGKIPPLVFSTECFSSRFKMVRMSFEDSFEKSNRRLCLEQEVVAVVRGLCSVYCFIQKIRNI